MAVRDDSVVEGCDQGSVIEECDQSSVVEGYDQISVAEGCDQISVVEGCDQISAAPDGLGIRSVWVSHERSAARHASRRRHRTLQ